MRLREGGGRMWPSPLRHYMTKYEEDGVLWVESWIQVNAFGRCWCLSRKRFQIEGRPLSGPSDGAIS